VESLVQAQPDLALEAVEHLPEVRAQEQDLLHVQKP
jgi:hypothetical protein